MAHIEIESEVAGRVWQIAAAVGAQLAEGDPIIILESMKMEIPVEAPAAGRLVELRVAVDDPVSEGQVVAVLDSG